VALRITHDVMTLEIDNRVMGHCRFREHAAEGNGAWIISTYPAWLFTCDQAITVLTIRRAHSRRVRRAQGRGLAAVAPGGLLRRAATALAYSPASVGLS